MVIDLASIFQRDMILPKNWLLIRFGFFQLFPVPRQIIGGLRLLMILKGIYMPRVFPLVLDTRQHWVLNLPHS